MNLNKHNAKNKNINFLIQNIMSNLAKIKKERLKNAIRIGIRFHPYPVPTKGVHRFGVKGKLAPHYIGPYEVTEKFGTVAYRIRLPDRLSAVHDVFHVSQLKKCEQIPEAQIIEETNAEIEPDLSLAEYPMRVLDYKERQTRRQKVKMYKIQWSHHTEEEATWETELFLNTKYPYFLPSQTHK
jgi:hypothetical protein